MLRSTLVRAGLVLLLAGAPALAQDRPPIPGLGGGNKPGDRPRIRIGDDRDPTPAPAPMPEDDDAGSGVDPVAEETERLFASLGTWPATEARQASIRLSAQATTLMPRLLRMLADPGSDWRQVCGAAATLGRSGDVRAVEAILAKLQDRKMYQHSGDLLDAVVRIDPIGAKPRLMAQLLHPASAVVAKARDRLEPRVGPGDVEYLRDIYTAGGSGARQHALELMALADPGGVRADLALALGDSTPAVSMAAAMALSHDDSDEALEAMRRAARAPIDRRMAYGYLAIGLRAEHSGEALLEPSDVRTLLGGRGLDHVERLNRAVAALVLADAGYFHEIDLLEKPLDTKIVPRLLDTWVSPEFWADMRVIQPLVLRRLRRLSGRSELREPREWRAWWDENRRTFAARRVLAAVAPSVATSMVVTVTGPTAPGGETTVLGASASELGPALSGELALLLTEEDAAALAAVVNESGILAANESPSGPLLMRDDTRITVRAGNRERMISFAPADSTEGVDSVLAAVAALRDRFRWQRYRTLDPTRDFAAFVRATSPLFAEDRPAAERERTLAQLIVDALNADRGVDWNVAALKDLESLSASSALLDDHQVTRLLTVLQSIPRADAMAHGLLRVLSATGRADVLTSLLDYVDAHVETGKDELLAAMLARTDEAGLRAGLTDRRPEVRVAALRALEPTSLGGNAAQAARGSVSDEDRWVRSAAVQSLGRLRDEESREFLTGLATERGELRIPALEALGDLGGKAALPALMTAFVNDDAALRIAAIGAFASCGEPQGYSAIVFAMAGDPSPIVREVAANAIVRIGTRRAADELRKLAIDPIQPPGPRARAVAGLAELRGREVAADLRRLTSDTAVEVGDEAALALARWRDPGGVPRLLEMLEAGRSVMRATRGLEMVSLESFPQEDKSIVAALYSGWWELTEDRGPRAWLVEALRLEGVDETALDDWISGRSGREVVPHLLRGLHSNRWFVRRACDLALRDVLGRKVSGQQEAWSTSGDVARMSADWQRIWEETIGQ